MWKASQIYEKLQYGALPEKSFIVGDSAYACDKFIVVPFKDNAHLTKEQKRFNYCVSSVRVVVEQAFGILKSKFRRLFYLNMKRIDQVPSVLMTACILHNICLSNGDDKTYPPEISVIEGRDENINYNTKYDRFKLRKDILNNINCTRNT